MSRVKNGSQRRCVFVVDDDTSIREVVTTALTDEGYGVCSAPDGATALSLLERPPTIPVAAILLDLRLPGMDGRTFATRYRLLPGPHAPLIVFTAAPASEAITAAEQLGAVGFVSKPFDLDTLLEVVARCLLTPSAPVELWPAPPTGTMPPPPKEALVWEGDTRRRHLRQLGAEVSRVQAELVRVRVAVQGLAAIEATRRLTSTDVRYRSTPLIDQEDDARLVALHRFLLGASSKVSRADRPPRQERAALPVAPHRPRR